MSQKAQFDVYSNLNILTQVQVEVLQKRQKEKKAMMEAVKRYRKGEFFILFVPINLGSNFNIKYA